MSAVSGFISGVVGLALLDAVISSTQATDRTAGVLTGAADLVRRLASPEIPAIPDLRIPASARPQLTPGAPAGSPGQLATPLAPAPSTGGLSATGTSYTRPATRLPVPVSV